MTKKIRVRSLLGVVCLAVGLICLTASGPAQENQINKGKIFQETYPLLTDSDLYCSIGVQEGPVPKVTVVGAERQQEKILFGDGDVIYINAGEKQGVAKDQVFLLFAVNDEWSMSSTRTGKSYGHLIQKNGRGRVIQVDENKAVLRVEKSCSPVRLGNYAVPFVEGQGYTGKNAGFVPYSKEQQGKTKGLVIFVGIDLTEAGTGNWVIIDLGTQDGLQPGNQVTILTAAASKLPRHATGNAVVVGVGKNTATVKILEAADPIRVGDQVEVK